jgi:hypothetical protein
MADPWEGLAHYIAAAIAIEPGTLGPLAGMIEVTAEMSALADAGVEALVGRAHAAELLRSDATAIDIALLVEQLAKSPLEEQHDQRGRDDLSGAACNARTRINAIAGLSAPAEQPLPGRGE